VGVDTAQSWVAGIVRADVAVVAVGRRAAHTGPRGASVSRGAGDAVIAGDGVGGVDAARSWVAGVGRADVAVVAVGRRAAHTGPRGAGVSRGTVVAVIAGDGVVGVDAARSRVAGVGGADVAVVAIGRRAAHTGPRGA